jgi:hypothetical protein
LKIETPEKGFLYSDGGIFCDLRIFLPQKAQKTQRNFIPFLCFLCHLWPRLFLGIIQRSQIIYSAIKNIKAKNFFIEKPVLFALFVANKKNAPVVNRRGVLG